MKINPPSAVRTLMYALSVAVNAFMGVVLTSDVELNVYIRAAVAAYNAVVAIMAGVNVTPDQE